MEKKDPRSYEGPRNTEGKRKKRSYFEVSFWLNQVFGKERFAGPKLPERRSSASQSTAKQAAPIEGSGHVGRCSEHRARSAKCVRKMRKFKES